MSGAQALQKPYACLTPEPWRPGWGTLWQGASVGAWLVRLPVPLVVVRMNDNGPPDCALLDHPRLVVAVEVAIDDQPTCVLATPVYLALVEGVLAWLRRGVHVYVHCAAGGSRSSYLTVGVVMAARGCGYAAALAAIRERWPIAQPNDGFARHLQDLAPQFSPLLQDRQEGPPCTERWHRSGEAVERETAQDPLIRMAAAADAPPLAARQAAVPAAYAALDYLLPPPGGAAAGAVPALGPAGLRGAAPPAASATWAAHLQADAAASAGFSLESCSVAGQQPSPYDFRPLRRAGQEVMA